MPTHQQWKSRSRANHRPRTSASESSTEALHLTDDSKNERRRRASDVCLNCGIRWRRPIILAILGAVIILSAVYCEGLIRRAHQESSKRAARGGSIARPQCRYATLVLFSPVNPQERFRRLQAIAETWGPSANTTFVVRNATDFWSGASVANSYNNSKIPKLMELPPGMSTEPHIRLLQYVIQRFWTETMERNDDTNDGVDFLFLVNDHTFVIPENVRAFLEQYGRPHEPFHAGHALLAQGKYPFNSGPTGFILSRHTIQKLVAAFQATEDPQYESCAGRSDAISGFLKTNPELLLTKCLMTELHTPLTDTRDNRGRHRFHTYGLMRMLNGDQDGWYKDYHEDPQNILDFANDTAKGSYSPEGKGKDCCSAQTVTFHYVQDAETRALFSIRRALMDSELSSTEISDQDLQRLIVDKWPTAYNALGGHAKTLPTEEDVESWKDLLFVLRLISSGKARLAQQ